MRYVTQIATTVVCLICVGPASATADPTVPGFTVDVYASVDLPMNMSFDETGILFVGNNSVWNQPEPISRVGLGGTPVEDYGPPLSDPDALVVHDPNSLIPASAGSVIVGGVLNQGLGHITEVRVDETGHAMFSNNTTVLNPSDFVYDSQGRLLISDYYTDRVYVSTGGDPVPLINVPGACGALAVDDLDRIFVWAVDEVIRVYAADGSLLDDSFISGIGVNPGMAFGIGGAWGDDLYTVSHGELLRIDAGGTPTVLGTGFSTEEFGVTDVEFGPDGALYVTDYPLNRILRIDFDVSSDAPDIGSIPVVAKLHQNAPNPFSRETRISFTLDQPGLAEVDVYDTAGRRVRRSLAGWVAEGRHSISLEGSGPDGVLGSGVYFYTLSVDGVVIETRQARLVR